MKFLLTLCFLISMNLLFSQRTFFHFKCKKYDSLVVQTLNSDHINLPLPDGKENYNHEVIIESSTRLFSQSADEFNKKLIEKTSYGSSQAMTPIYDVQFLYYRNGEIKDKVEIALSTNNLFSTFPLRVQRQGDCMCKGNGGYCCSEGGISEEFRKFIVQMLKDRGVEIYVE